MVTGITIYKRRPPNEKNTTNQNGCHSTNYTLCAIEPRFDGDDIIYVNIKVTPDPDNIVQFIENIKKKVKDECDILCGYEATVGTSTGAGTGLTAGWNGAPVLCRGVRKIRIAESEERLEKLDSDMNQKKEMVEAILPAYRRFKSWAEEFDTADLEQKKMIAYRLFDRIELGKDYNIIMHMNVTYQQFCSEWKSKNSSQVTA